MNRFLTSRLLLSLVFVVAAAYCLAQQPKPGTPAQPKPVAPTQPKPGAPTQPGAPAQPKAAAPTQPKAAAPAQPKAAVPAQSKTATPAQPKPAAAEAPVSPDEEQIRRAVVAFVEQYNAHQADAVAALFAADARMVFRDGSEVNGTEEIKQTFEEAFSTSPKGLISVDVDSIRFLTSDVALEEGSTKMYPDGETLTSVGRYTVLHLKRDGRWQMQAVRVVEEESLSSYGELQILEFLIGDWIDQDRSEIVETNFEWDDNKSFLIETFQVVREGSVVLKGTQRIGWDPQAKQIRSWIFDSEGGFGEAFWHLVEDRWVVKSCAVLSDGSSASATRSLWLASPERLIWTSTDRMLSDEQLPDITVTMVRKPPEPN